MDLQISAFLLSILFTAGHSLSCYECIGLKGSCSGQMLKTCPSRYSQCESGTVVTQVGDITSKVKIKDCAVACQSGSMNFGITKLTTSCCNTNQCNAKDSPDPSNVPNGKKCFYCDDKSCSNTVSCSGTEDRCIKASGTYGGQLIIVKGCASKSICDSTSVSSVESISCCDGILCNGAQSLIQSFLFLCGSLLSLLLLP